MANVRRVRSHISKLGYDGDRSDFGSIQPDEEKFMRGTLMVLVGLVVAALWLQAQEGHPGREGLDSAENYPPVVSGCLERSGFYYAVVGKDGTAYDLTGSTTHLSQYVGHEVEVTGKPTVVSVSTTMIHAASTVEEYPALEIKTVKELSGACSADKP